VPEAITGLFSLIEEHKNLRRAYQRIQAELWSLYRQGIDSKDGNFSSSNQEVLKSMSRRLRLQRREQSHKKGGLLLKIMITQPIVYLPAATTENITSMLQSTSNQWLWATTKKRWARKLPKV